ncbi:MAG: DsbE family thiol:disulfide interchange protein [Hyphomicrobiaceae bacterium]|nr:DsbE family thiol:disulfide interchange protein [Hyphomicrobiaceae bacterium]
MRRAVIFGLPIVLLAGLFFLFATQIGRDTKLVPSVLINKPVPDFTLTGIGDGDPGFSSADLLGHVSVVNVFASWCVPCRDEHPLLTRLAAEEQDIVLYGIDQKDPADQARAFLADMGNPYAVIGADRNGRVSIDWGVYGVPETFVVNAAGIITYKHVGPITEESYESSLLPAIRDAAAG